MSYLDYPAGPERRAYIAGANAEAQVRDAPRKALPEQSRELLDYLDALAEHRNTDIQTPGQIVAHSVRIFISTMSRAERREIRRALRGRR